MANLGQRLAEMMQAQQQPAMQQPGMMPMSQQQQPMMPVQFDPYGQQQTGLAQALMKGIGYART